MHRIFRPVDQGFTRGNWLIDFAIVFHFQSFMHLAPFVYKKITFIIFVDMVLNRAFIGHNFEMFLFDFYTA